MQYILPYGLKRVDGRIKIDSDEQFGEFLVIPKSSMILHRYMCSMLSNISSPATLPKHFLNRKDVMSDRHRDDSSCLLCSYKDSSTRHACHLFELATYRRPNHKHDVPANWSCPRCLQHDFSLRQSPYHHSTAFFLLIRTY